MLSPTASLSLQLLSRRTALYAYASNAASTTPAAAVGPAMTRTARNAAGLLSASSFAARHRAYATQQSGNQAAPAEENTPSADTTPATATEAPSQPAGSPAPTSTSTSTSTATATATATPSDPTPAPSATTPSALDPILSTSPTPPAAEAPLSTSSTSPSSSESALSRSSSLAESYLDYTEVVANPTQTRGSTFPGDTTKAKAKGSGTKSSIEQKRANLTRFFIGAGLLSLGYGAWSLGKPWENEAERLKLCGRSEDQDAIKGAELGGFQGWVARTKLRGFDILDVSVDLDRSPPPPPRAEPYFLFVPPRIQYYNKPAWDPLLPRPLPEPHYRPYTLVIDLDDMLIHPIWDTKHGWRTVKRPGVDYFLAYLSQFYEIVLFTSQPSYTAAPIVEQLDPYGAYIPWKLYKESLRFKNGTYIKDLSYLDRPLERTIILDTDPAYTQLQPTNAIHLTPWKGTRGDPTSKELVALIPFLEALAVRRVQDVRPVIQHYEGKHIPTAYAEVEAKMKKELVDKWERERQAMGQGWGRWVREAFAGIAKVRHIAKTYRVGCDDSQLILQPRDLQKPSDQPPELDIEKQRRISQKLYEEEQKYWKDNEALIKKQIEEDKERQLKEMKGSLLTFMGIAPPPRQQASEGQAGR
ncbi:BQ5605_C004g02795 [Microbotryum silenes-dioicae]|uniref:Mitochondrial import inner membrane translocase subunit TIM50 n=1 Tax=Microbotryum silenes-dioicae TaxID=796604 RepID=A0A2X0PB59_9BASI|nr:BQ5605_C004g02795 [Microbotryum silenes-dioicae]